MNLARRALDDGLIYQVREQLKRARRSMPNPA
jgi:hypothetical protein